MPMLWFALDAVDAHDAPATVTGANGALVRAARSLDSESLVALPKGARCEVAALGWAWDGAAAIARRARVTARLHQRTPVGLGGFCWEVSTGACRMRAQGRHRG